MSTLTIIISRRNRISGPARRVSSMSSTTRQRDKQLLRRRHRLLLKALQLEKVRVSRLSRKHRSLALHAIARTITIGPTSSALFYRRTFNCRVDTTSISIALLLRHFVIAQIGGCLTTRVRMEEPDDPIAHPKHRMWRMKLYRQSSRNSSLLLHSCFAE